MLTDETAVFALEQKLASQELALDHLLSAASRSAAGGTTGGTTGGTKTSAGSSTSKTGGTGTTGTSSGTAKTGGTGGTAGAPVSAAQLAADQASIDANQAALTVAEQNLSQASIIAPISGVVSAVGLTVGRQATAGSNSQSVQIIGGHEHVVTIGVDVAKIAQVAVGNTATVTPDGSSSQLRAKVVAVGIVPATSGGTSYTVTLGLLDNPSGLRDGTNASVTLVTNQTAGSLTVPTSAVHYLGQQAYVLVPNGSGTQITRVSIGATGAVYTQITSGLKAGQQVVLADPAQPLPTAGINPRFGGGGLGGGLGGGGGVRIPGAGRGGAGRPTG